MAITAMTIACWRRSTATPIRSADAFKSSSRSSFHLDPAVASMATMLGIRIAIVVRRKGQLRVGFRVTEGLSGGRVSVRVSMARQDQGAGRGAARPPDRGHDDQADE